MKPGVTLYLSVSFAVAWICWGACWLIADTGTQNISLTPILILGSFGPFIAAGLCSWVGNGPMAMLRFYRRALQWRMGWLVFLLAFCLVPALAIITALIYAKFTGQVFAIQIPWAQLPLAYLWLFILGGPLGEEFGWSYLSDRLDEKLAIPAATFLLGVIWGVWHLPLFFLKVPGLLQHYMPFSAFLAFSVALRFLFSWAYHIGGKNILSNLIFHNALNFALSIVVIVPPVVQPFQVRLWLLTGLSAASALLLWVFVPIRPMSEQRKARTR